MALKVKTLRIDPDVFDEFNAWRNKYGFGWTRIFKHLLKQAKYGKLLQELKHEAGRDNQETMGDS